MAHEIAKLILEHAGRFIDRAEAVDVALWLGMPLHEIEEYLDWLESIRGAANNGRSEDAEQEDDRPS